MNYDVFLRLQDGTLVPAEGETEQVFMERVLRSAYETGAASERIYEAIKPSFFGCDSSEKTVSVLFRAEDWMLNPQDTLHGGILSTAMDMTMSVLARYVRKQRGAATVQLSINFIRPVNKGEEFLVTASTDHSGRRSTVIRAEVVVKSTGKLAATASGVFM